MSPTPYQKYPTVNSGKPYYTQGESIVGDKRSHFTHHKVGKKHLLIIKLKDNKQCQEYFF